MEYVEGKLFENQSGKIYVLNYIQKEEHKHDEAISQYMQSKRLYNVQ